MLKTQQSRMLKMREVRAILPLSVGTLYGLISSRKLESVRVGKTILVPESALEAFIEKNTTEVID